MTRHLHLLFTWCLVLLMLGLIGCGSGATPVARDTAAHDELPSPRRPDSTASPAPSEPLADWCAGHALPESKCTKCNPELIEQFKAAGDWCGEHGFPESACPICNPQSRPHAEPEREASDWCAGHALPESKCTKCNPELTEQFKAAGDWCGEHGFPESACPICDPQAPPDAGDEAPDWCLEHALPESTCTRCNPELIEQFKATGDWCGEHGFPESACPICSPQIPPAQLEIAALEARIVRLRAPELEAAAGIQTVAAQRMTTASSIECAAHIEYDTDRLADVRALVPGVVRNIHAQVGAHVELGDPLFDLDSADIGAIQAALLSARERARAAEVNLTRQQELRDADIASARQLELAQQELGSAKAEVRAAQAALKMAGAAGSGPVGRYTITAPITGTILRRPSVLGTHADGDASLATVGDTSVMWALCAVPEAFADRLSLGQALTISSNTSVQLSIEGAITWVAPEVDVQTRTVTVRAEVPNPEGALRANQFMRGQISMGHERSVVSAPRAAVQRVGARELVFVRTAVGVYEPRVVERRGGGETVEIEGRVAPGDQLVTTGAILLRTEILPGSIGAGCCEVDAPGGE